MSKSFDPIWEEIYGAGQQLNRYPFNSVVTFLYRNRPRDKKPQETKILEVGCGAGNNIWFAAREGFDVTGIDGSTHAVEYARKRFEEEGLKGVIEVGDFTKLTYADNTFDIVIDRGAITQVGRADAFKAVNEANRVLKKGGIFYSEIYSDRSSSRGKLLEDGLIIDEGALKGVGQVCYHSKSGIMDIFSKNWNIIGFSHAEVMDCIKTPYEMLAYWMVTAVKQ